MKDNLMIRIYKNLDKNSNSTGTSDYWIYSTDSGILLCTYMDIPEKYDSEYVVRLYKKELKESKARTVPTKYSEGFETKSTAVSTKVADTKKIMPKEIANFFE